jgi:hypothetical protein
MQMQNQVLLKNGQLQAADLLQHVRWQIVISVTQSALASLESTQVVQALLAWERKGIIAFIVHAIDTLSSRLRCIAHREDALSSQTAIEHGLSDVLRSAVEYILVASRVSAMSDEAFVKDFTDNFVLPLLKGPMSKYPPLVEVLFDSIKGIFDIAQVTKSELVSTAGHFLRVLKRKKPSVFDIPEGRVVQPYCGIRNIDNAPVFDLLLRLEPPRNKPSLYANYYLDMLSEQQREVIWTYFNDLDYVCKQLVDDGGLKDQLVFIKILTELPNSPRARLPIVKALLDHPKIDDHSVTQLYPLLDISDPPSRDVLHKNTYKRLFTDRLVAYQDLMTATWAQDSPKAYIATMKFLIPRIKNEILPDAGQIPDILYKNGVGDVLHLLTRATDEEVKEVAKLYLAWEKQNNEAVSQVSTIGFFFGGGGITAI